MGLALVLQDNSARNSEAFAARHNYCQRVRINKGDTGFGNHDQYPSGACGRAPSTERGRHIRVRPGVYPVNAPLMVPDRTTLEGAGIMRMENGLPAGFEPGTVTTIARRQILKVTC